MQQISCVVLFCYWSNPSLLINGYLVNPVGLTANALLIRRYADDTISIASDEPSSDAGNCFRRPL